MSKANTNVMKDVGQTIAVLPFRTHDLLTRELKKIRLGMASVRRMESFYLM